MSSTRTRVWLVTGATGQVGSACRALAGEYGVKAIGYPERLMNVRSSDEVRRVLDKERPDVVLNTAAVTAVDRCESEDKALAQRVNARAPGLFAEACRGGPLLVQMSTDFVFDGRASTPIPEDAPTGPLSVYGETKRAGEEAVRSSGAEHLVVRTQWVFGSGPNFVRTIVAAAGKGQALRVVEDQLGRPTWASSLARALFAAVRSGARGDLHLTNEGIASWHEFARAIVEEAARRGLCPRVDVRPIRTSEMPRPARRPAYGVLALDRARALGIESPHWRDALSQYLEVMNA